MICLAYQMIKLTKELSSESSHSFKRKELVHVDNKNNKEYYVVMMMTPLVTTGFHVSVLTFYVALLFLGKYQYLTAV